MHVFDEMKAYVGFDEADGELLAAFWPVVEPYVDDVVGHFYECIDQFPDARAVLADTAQVDRLRRTLKVWVRELLEGPYDQDYYERRQRIGRRHVEVGLPPRFMFTSMSVMRSDLCAIATEQVPAATGLRQAIRRITELDLAIMTGTFIERREERQFTTLQQLLVSHIPVTVILADEEGVVTAATGAHRRLFGDRDVLGRAYTQALPSELVEEAHLVETVRRAITSGSEISILRVDVRMEHRDRSFRLDVVPLDHPNARVLLHVEELTEAVETEARMQRSEALAQLGALSAAVAHELRNPLAGISGAIQVISRSLDEQDRRRAVMVKVEEQIRRLNTLVTELLAFARPGMARMVDVDLRSVVSAVLELLRAEHPDVELVSLGSGLGRGDPNMVHQIVLNLAQNAIQAMDGEGQVLIRIDGSSLVVADSGPGVPPELRPDVFKPFFTTRTRGTGLGLAVCRRAADAMSASIDLLDQGPLPGAAFQLTLQARDPGGPTTG